MLLETSAIGRAVWGEVGSERLRELLNRTTIVAAATICLLEAGLVLSWRGVDARVALPALLDALHAERIPFGDEHQRVALAAFSSIRSGTTPRPTQLREGGGAECRVFSG
jgi:uncharacterized protein with PIN domain